MIHTFDQIHVGETPYTHRNDWRKFPRLPAFKCWVSLVTSFFLPVILTENVVDA